MSIPASSNSGFQPFQRIATSLILGGSALMVLLGCSSESSRLSQAEDSVPSPVIVQKGQLHREVWKTVYEFYYDKEFKGIDWATAGRETNELLDEANDVEAVYGVLKKMVGYLNDRHTYILSPQEYADTSRVGFIGDGITTSHHNSAEDVDIVIRVAPDSPAEKAGVLPGWLLLNGKEVFENPTVVGQSRHYRFLDHREQLQEMDIVAAALPVSADLRDSSLLKSGTLYLRFDRFEKGIAEWVAQQLLAYPTANSLILDLRWNPGGYKKELDEMLELFLPEYSEIGSVVTRKNSRIQEFTSSTYQRGPTELPMAVLVSPYSASCSEILASVVQYHHRGKIVGPGKTAGEVLFSPGWILPEGGLLKIAARDYLTPGGERLQGNGVVPDIITDPRSFFELRRGLDPTMDQALSEVVPNKTVTKHSSVES